MSWKVPLVILVALSVSACGTDVTTNNPFDPETPSHEQAPAAVQGVVFSQPLDGSEAVPLAEARVSLSGPTESASGVITTGEDGAWGLTRLEPGAYTLEVRHAGHFRFARDLVLGPGESRTLDTTLDPVPTQGDARVGHVTGTAHKSGELVQPEAEQDHSGIIVEVEDAGVRTVTNAAGRFDLFLEPGTYNLLFSARSYNLARRNGVVATAGDMVTVPDDPVVLDANPGTVSGRVLLEGLPPSEWQDTTVSLQGGGTTTTAPDGTFRITGVAAGTYTLSALRDGYDTVTALGVVVEGGRDTAVPDIELAISRGTLVGRVDKVDEDDDSGVIVSLTGTTYTAVTAEDGRFRIDGVAVGVYEARANRERYVTAVQGSVTIGADEITDVGTLNLVRIQGDFLVDGGAPYTNDPAGEVTVTLNNGTAAAYRVSEDPAFADDTDPFIPYPAEPDVAFSLTDRDGLHTVWVQYQETDGTRSRNFSSTITLDRSPPEQAEVVIDGGAAFTNDPGAVVNLSLSASDATSGVGRILVSNSELTSAELAAAPFVSFRSAVLHALADPAADGAKTVWVYFEDLAGNVTFPGVDAAITLDRAPPSLTALTLNCGAEEDAAYCADPMVTVALQATGAERMALSNEAGIPVTVWEPFDMARRWAVAPGDGNRTVYVKLIDGAGNETAVFSDALIVDTTPPSGVSVVLEGTIADGATSNVLSSGSSVDLQVTASDANGLTHMWVANDDGFANAGPRAFATAVTAWDLEAGDGDRRAFVRVADAAGNTVTVSAAIRVDTVGPVLTSAQLLEGGASGVVSDTAATLEVQVAGADQVRLSGDFTDGFAGSWMPVAGRIAVNLDGSTSGARTVTVEARDLAGNASSPASVEAAAILDLDAPDAASIVIEGGASHTTTREVELDLTAADPTTSVTGVALADGALDCATATYEAFTSRRSLTLDVGDGSRTVTACFRDLAGNVASASDTIILDTSAPSTVSLELAAGAGTVSDALGVPVTVSATDNLTGAAALTMRLSEDPVFAGRPWVAFTPSASVDLAEVDGNHTVYLQVRDEAGNITEASDSVVLDRVPPESPAFALEPTDQAASPSVLGVFAASGATHLCLSGDVIEAVTTDGCGATGWIPFTHNLSLQLTSGDGPKSVSVVFRDEGGLTTEPQTDEVVLDTAPPVSTSVLIAGGASHTTSRTVDLDLTASDATSGVAAMAIGNGTLDCASASYGPVETARTWTLSVGDGTKTVVACFRDAAGNTVSASSTILLDTQAPTGVGIVLAGGAPYVDDGAAVPVDLTATDNLTGMADLQLRLSEDSTFAGATWQSFTASTTIDLSPGDGQRSVFLQVRDAAGNVTSASDMVTVDSTAPVAGSLRLTPTDYATTTAITAAFSANGASQLCLNGDVVEVSTTDGCVNTGWIPYVGSMSLTLTGSDGTKSVSVRFRDEAGLTSTVVTDAVVLDRDVPAGPSVSVEAGATHTPTATVNLTLSATDATSGVSSMAVANGTIDCASAVYESYRTSTSWTLPAPDGSKAVAVCFRDAAGNAVSASGSIILDTTAPAPVSLAIEGGAAFTTTAAVSLGISASDNLTPTGGLQMRVSEDPTFAGVAWEAYATARALTLSDSDGAHTVYLEVRDQAHNVSRASDTIVLDTVAPTAPSLVLSPTDYAVSTAITGAFSASGATWLCLTGDVVDVSTTDGCASTGWIPYVGSMSLTLTGGDGTKTVSVRFRDDAGLTSATVTDEVILDTDAPDVSSASVTLTGLAAGGPSTEHTRVATVTVDISGPVDAASGVTHMQLSEDAGFVGAVWQTSTTPLSYTLSAGDGLKTVRVRFRDAAGRVSEPVAGAIRLDTTPPVLSTIALGEGLGATVTTETSRRRDVRVEITASDSGAGLADYKISRSSDFSGASWAPLATSPHLVNWDLFDPTVPTCRRSVYLSEIDTGTPDLVELHNPTAGDVDLTGWALDCKLDSGVVNTWVLPDIGIAPGGRLVLDEGTGTSTAGRLYMGSNCAWATTAGSATLRDALGHPVDFVRFNGSVETAPAGIGWTDDVPLACPSAACGRTALSFDRDLASDWCPQTGTPEQANGSTCALTTADCANIEGTRRVHVRVRDAAGNETVAETSTLLDLTAPSVSITAAQGARYSTDPTVTVAVEASDRLTGVAALMTSTDPSVLGGWQPFTGGTALELTGGDAAYKVYVHVADHAGNETPVLWASDAVVIDTVPPTAGTVTVTGLGDGGPSAVATRSTFVTVDLAGFFDATSGVQEMKLWETGQSEPSSWSPFADSLHWQLTSGDGTKVLNVKVRDAAQLESTVAQGSIVLDQTPPSSPSIFVARDGDTEPAVLTPSAAVDLFLSAEGATQMMFDNTYRFTSASWVAYSELKRDHLLLPWTLSCITYPYGRVRTVYARFKDAVGNLSSITSYRLVLDPCAPSTPVVRLSGSPGAYSSEYVRSLDTSATITGTAGATMMRVEATSGACPAPATMTAQDLSSSLVVTFDGEGLRRLCVALEDDAGNLSAVGSDTITVDTTPPASPNLTPSNLTGVNAACANIDPGVGSSVDTNFWQWQARGNGGPWLDVGASGPINFDLLQDTANLLEVRAIDRAGNGGASNVAYVEEQSTALFPTDLEVKAICNNGGFAILKDKAAWPGAMAFPDGDGGAFMLALPRILLLDLETLEVRPFSGPGGMATILDRGADAIDDGYANTIDVGCPADQNWIVFSYVESTDPTNPPLGKAYSVVWVDPLGTPSTGAYAPVALSDSTGTGVPVASFDIVTGTPPSYEALVTYRAYAFIIPEVLRKLKVTGSGSSATVTVGANIAGTGSSTAPLSKRHIYGTALHYLNDQADFLWWNESVGRWELQYYDSGTTTTLYTYSPGTDPAPAGFDLDHTPWGRLVRPSRFQHGSSWFRHRQTVWVSTGTGRIYSHVVAGNTNTLIGQGSWWFWPVFDHADQATTWLDHDYTNRFRVGAVGSSSYTAPVQTRDFRYRANVWKPVMPTGLSGPGDPVVVYHTSQPTGGVVVGLQDQAACAE